MGTLWGSHDSKPRRILGAKKKAGLAAERLVDEATPQMFSTCGSDKCDNLKE